MMLGFKRRFAPFVKDGSKRHTIRDRKPPRIGEILHCYVDPRQKTMALLGRWPCVKVEEINIYTRGDGTFGVVVDKVELDLSEKAALAIADGFRSTTRKRAFAEMMRFWIATHGDGSGIVELPDGQPKVAGVSPGLDFHGHIIHWDYDHPAPTPAPKRSKR